MIAFTALADAVTRADGILPAVITLIAVALAALAAWWAVPSAADRGLTPIRPHPRTSGAVTTGIESAADPGPAGRRHTGAQVRTPARSGAHRASVLAALLLGAAAALLSGLGPLLAVIVGGGTAVLAWWVLTRLRERGEGADASPTAPDAHVRPWVPPRPSSRARRQIAQGAPAFAALLAACLAAGASPRRALAVVEPALASHPGLAVWVRGLARRLDLGEAPGIAWAQFADLDPSLRPIALSIAWSADTGAPLADTLSRLATGLRQQQRQRVIAAARTAGVWLVLPLGACFLPAFLCLGVLPVVASLLSDLL